MTDKVTNTTTNPAENTVTSIASDKILSQCVTYVHWWTKSLVTFRITRPKDYQFLPGQFVRLGLAQADEVFWRAYSIASAPQADYLEFYGVIVDGGVFTAQLKNIQPGDVVLLEKQSYGFLTIDRFTGGQALWMLATGTGIGPFLSVVRDTAVWKIYQDVILVHSVKFATEFAYQDELIALKKQILAQSGARLHLVQTATRESVPAINGVECLSGRITTLLENGDLEQTLQIPISAEASRIMLCGNPKMIEEIRVLLRARGLAPCRRHTLGQYLTENYW